MQMTMIQDEPYSGIIELLDDLDAVVPMPEGSARMHVRRHFGGALEVDLTPYVTREPTRVLVNVPASVTRTLGGTLVTDIWVGDTRLAQYDLVVSRSATLR